MPSTHDSSTLNNLFTPSNHTHCRFFPAVFYMATSKLSMAVMGNMSFALTLLVYRIIVKVCQMKAHAASYHHIHHPTSSSSATFVKPRSR